MHQSGSRLQAATAHSGDPDSLIHVCASFRYVLSLTPQCLPSSHPLVLVVHTSDFAGMRSSASSLVMAEQSAHDVVDQSMSVGDHSPSDAYEDQSNHHSTGDVASAEARTGIYDEERSDQDGQPVQTRSASYAIVNGQAHVCSAGLLPAPPILILYGSRTSLAESDPQQRTLLPAKWTPTHRTPTSVATYREIRV